MSRYTTERKTSIRSYWPRGLGGDLRQLLPDRLTRAFTGSFPSDLANKLADILPGNLSVKLPDGLSRISSKQLSSRLPRKLQQFAGGAIEPERALKMLHLVPIVGRLGGSLTTGLVSVLPISDETVTQYQQQAGKQWEQGMEQLQEFYFDNPWFMITFVHSLSAIAQAGTVTIRIVLGALQSVYYTQRRDIILDSLQPNGYRSFMAAYLTIGTAMGYFRGGPVHVRLIRHNDQILPVKEVAPFLPGPGSEPQQTTDLWEDPAPMPTADVVRGQATHPAEVHYNLRRAEAPTTLADTILDMDDLYWSSASGMVMKIVAVGTHPNYRWVVVVPGTDHMAAMSVANPADTESNIREMLGVRSAARAGVERALNSAMEALNVPVELRPTQQVLMVGHSQGGVTAHALAADPLYDARVTHVLTIGSPSRAIKIPEGVRSVSVEHIQDCIPWIDGLTEPEIDDRVIVRRFLDKPKRNPLHYAHATSTYLDTVKLMEEETARKVELADSSGQPLDRTAQEVLALQSVLPKPGEDTEVLFYEIAQEILEWAPLVHDREGWITNLVPDADGVLAALVERAIFDPAGAEPKLDKDYIEALEWAEAVKAARRALKKTQAEGGNHTKHTNNQNTGDNQ